MATIEGTGGSCTLPSGFDGAIGGFKADVNVAVVDVSAFSDNGYRARKPTIVDITGSATGVITDAATPTSGTLLSSTAGLSAATGSVTLTYAAGCTHTFNAVISKVSISRNVTDRSDTSWDFSSTGAITQAWSD